MRPHSTSASSPPELTVLIPCHNASQKIEAAVVDWVAALEQVTPFEIVVINDGSNDGSARILDSLRRDHPQLRVIHQLHTGEAQAIRRGYDIARGTYVLELPLVGSFEPRHFWPLWERRLSYQVLVAFSDHPNAKRRLTEWPGHLLEKWLNFLFGIQLRSGLSQYRLCRTHVVGPMMKRLPLPYDSVGTGICLLVHREYPFGIREVPVPLAEAASRTPGARRALLIGLEALQLWWATRRPWFRRRRPKTA
jgi:hypothetical protein